MLKYPVELDEIEESIKYVEESQGIIIRDNKFWNMVEHNIIIMRRQKNVEKLLK